MGNQMQNYSSIRKQTVQNLEKTKKQSKKVQLGGRNF